MSLSSFIFYFPAKAETIDGIMTLHTDIGPYHLRRNFQNIKEKPGDSGKFPGACALVQLREIQWQNVWGGSPSRDRPRPWAPWLLLPVSTNLADSEIEAFSLTINISAIS